jgi:rhamnose transport system substrate-binding protein
MKNSYESYWSLLISASDPNAIVPFLKKAMDQKIKIVTVDSDTAPAGRELFINQVSAEAIGQSLRHLKCRRYDDF